MLVPGIARAVRSSTAPKVYVCNVATQRGETDGYAIADHLDALQAHTFAAIVACVIANRPPVGLEPPFAGEWVVNDRRLVNTVQFCLIAGVSRATLYNWLKAGKIEAARTAGGQLRIYADSLLRRDPRGRKPHGHL